jgi:hypothetical protein
MNCFWSCLSVRSVPLLAMLILLMSAQAASAARGRSVPRQTTLSLNTETQQALLAAVDDERKARAFYAAVMKKHGDIRPLSNIILAEERHAAALLALCRKYGVAVPEDRWASEKFDVPDRLSDVCALAAQAERDNVAIYDRLLGSVREPDIRQVMERLRAASLENHLPAFERCAGRGGNSTPAGARRGGWRRGW